MPSTNEEPRRPHVYKVSTVEELVAAREDAKPGDTISLAPGVYDLGGTHPNNARFDNVAIKGCGRSGE